MASSEDTIVCAKAVTVIPAGSQQDAAAKEQYLDGRWEIEGRRLRYEAGSDIALATLRILTEYVADCESPYFQCVHEGDLEQARVLVARGQLIRAGEIGVEEDDLAAWATWLHKVADLLPRLWD